MWTWKKKFFVVTHVYDEKSLCHVCMMLITDALKNYMEKI